MQISNPKWSASGGKINDDGVFVAVEEGPTGAFIVRAEMDGLEAIAEGRIASAETGPGHKPDNPAAQVIRWQGEVPPQKWMNFYTKILSRLVSSPQLKIAVSFEMPVANEQDRAKAVETRAGLKELGLDDDVELR